MKEGPSNLKARSTTSIELLSSKGSSTSINFMPHALAKSSGFSGVVSSPRAVCSVPGFASKDLPWSSPCFGLPALEPQKILLNNDLHDMKMFTAVAAEPCDILMRRRLYGEANQPCYPPRDSGVLCASSRHLRGTRARPGGRRWADGASLATLSDPLISSDAATAPFCASTEYSRRPSCIDWLSWRS